MCQPCCGAVVHKGRGAGPELTPTPYWTPGWGGAASGVQKIPKTPKPNGLLISYKACPKWPFQATISYSLHRPFSAPSYCLTTKPKNHRAPSPCSASLRLPGYPDLFPSGLSATLLGTVRVISTLVRTHDPAAPPRTARPASGTRSNSLSQRCRSERCW